MVPGTDAGDVHGVALVVPGVGRVLGAGDGVDLDRAAVAVVEADGVVVHRLQHRARQAHAAAGGDAVRGTKRQKKIN